MQLIMVLICVTLTSVAEAVSISYITYPKFNLISPPVQTWILERPVQRLPEERRRFDLFPRLNQKFVVTAAPYRIVTRPIRKPLMKRMMFRYKSPALDNAMIEVITAPPRYTEYSIENNLQVAHDMEHKVNKIDKESSSEIPIENSVKAKEMDNAVSQKIKVVTDPTVTENIKAKNPILNSTESDIESLSQNRVLHLDDVKFNDEDNQIADSKEFIFLKPSKQVEKDVDDMIEEYATVANEPYTPPSRVKRSDNVIEEENLGTTMAGYKFTWRDTRLTNNIDFKNINS